MLRKRILTALVGLSMLALPVAALAHDRDHDGYGRPYAWHDQGWHRGWSKHREPDADDYYRGYRNNGSYNYSATPYQSYGGLLGSQLTIRQDRLLQQRYNLLNRYNNARFRGDRHATKNLGKALTATNNALRVNRQQLAEFNGVPLNGYYRNEAYGSSYPNYGNNPYYGANPYYGPNPAMDAVSSLIVPFLGGTP